MSLGGNLTYQIKPILINTLTAADFGVFTNTATSQKELMFKKAGLSLPYKNAAGTIIASSAVVAGRNATRKVVLTSIDTECPCADCNIEYGFTLERRVAHPGVLNSEYYPHSVTYAGKLKSIGCTTGVIDAAYVTLMRNDLIDQVANHVKYSPQGFDAVAEAALAKIITFNNTQALVINGVTITVTGNTIAEAVAEINLAPTTLVKAYVLPASFGANKFVIIAANGTTSITLTSTTMTIDAVDYIGLTGKEDDVTFSVKDTQQSVTTETVVGGNFSFMTPDDVWREFSQVAHDGHLANQHKVEKPLNVPYTKYIFKELMPTASIHGASHGNDYLVEVHVYIPTSYLDDDLWDADGYMWESTTDNAGFTPDQTFNEIITYWKA